MMVTTKFHQNTSPKTGRASIPTVLLHGPPQQWQHGTSVHTYFCMGRLSPGSKGRSIPTSAWAASARTARTSVHAFFSMGRPSPGSSGQASMPTSAWAGTARTARGKRPLYWRPPPPSRLFYVAAIAQRLLAAPIRCTHASNELCGASYGANFLTSCGASYGANYLASCDANYLASCGANYLASCGENYLSSIALVVARITWLVVARIFLSSIALVVVPITSRVVTRITSRVEVRITSPVWCLLWILEYVLKSLVFN